MSFLTFSHVLVSEKFISHVIQGEPDEAFGGHISGLSRPGKTEFPSSWSHRHIVEAINLILEQPEVVTFSGKRVFLQKNIRGVQIELKLVVTKKGFVPTSCFPVGGEGVIRNIGVNRCLLKGIKNGKASSMKIMKDTTAMAYELREFLACQVSRSRLSFVDSALFAGEPYDAMMTGFALAYDLRLYIPQAIRDE